MEEKGQKKGYRASSRSAGIRTETRRGTRGTFKTRYRRDEGIIAAREKRKYKQKSNGMGR